MRWLNLVAKGIVNPAKAIASLSGGIMPRDTEYRRLRSWRYGRLSRVDITDVVPAIVDVDLRLEHAFDRKIGTSLDLFELAILCGTARTMGVRSVLEVGTYDGNTALNLAANTDPGTAITTVDLPADWNGKFRIPIPRPDKHVVDLKQIGVQFLASEYRSRIVQVLADSAALDWRTLGGPFDFVLIDGCHHYDYVRSDTENAFGVLAAGGVVFWHDYGQIYDVSRVVDEHARRIRVHAIRGTRLAMTCPTTTLGPASDR